MKFLLKPTMSAILFLLAVAPAMATPQEGRGMLPDLIEVAGRESLVVTSGSDTCREAVSRYGGTCKYLGGGYSNDFPNGKYGYVHKVEIR